MPAFSSVSRHSRSCFVLALARMKSGCASSSFSRLRPLRLPILTVSSGRSRCRSSQASSAVAHTSPPDNSQTSAKLPKSAATRWGCMGTVTSRPRSSVKVRVSSCGALAVSDAAGDTVDEGAGERLLDEDDGAFVAHAVSRESARRAQREMAAFFISDLPLSSVYSTGEFIYKRGRCSVIVFFIINIVLEIVRFLLVIQPQFKPARKILPFTAGLNAHIGKIPNLSPALSCYDQVIAHAAS